MMKNKIRRPGLHMEAFCDTYDERHPADHLESLRFAPVIHKETAALIREDIQEEIWDKD